MAWWLISICQFNTLLNKSLLCDYNVPGNLLRGIKGPSSGMPWPFMLQKDHTIDIWKLDLRKGQAKGLKINEVALIDTQGRNYGPAN